MVEIGKLTANVERLMSDVKGQGDKVDAIKHQVSFVRGAVWASAGFLTVLISVVSFFLSSKWTAVETAVGALQKSETAAAPAKK